MQSNFSPNYSIEYLNLLRTKSTHLKSGNTIITDAPTDNHGRGEAFSPTDLLSSSLVSCIMTIMGIAAERDGIEIVSMKADVSKEMTSNPRMVDAVRAIINVEIKGSEDDAERLKRTGLACPVGRSLSKEVVIQFNQSIEKAVSEKDLESFYKVIELILQKVHDRSIFIPQKQVS